MYLRLSIITTIAIAILAIFYEKYFVKTYVERRVWLTLLGSENYLPGVLALARSMKRANSIYPLVVMMNKDDISEETQNIIANEGCLIRFIERLYPNSTTGLAFEYLYHTWKKLRAFELVDICDKCVFIDADIILLQNIDELFELYDTQYIAAVTTCVCNLKKTPTYPKDWKPENCPYTDKQHSHSTAHDNTNKTIFNSGLFLFRPNLTTFQQMVHALNTWDLREFKFGDQDFLNKFYRDTSIRIPYIYHGIKVLFKSHKHLWDLTKLKTIHYMLGKPWDKSSEDDNEYESINQLWWQAYEWKSEKQK